MSAEIHVAGPVERDKQRCSRCGYILIDAEGAMAPVGSPGMRAWEPGRHVEVQFAAGVRGQGLTSLAPTCRASKIQTETLTEERAAVGDPPE